MFNRKQIKLRLMDQGFNFSDMDYPFTKGNWTVQGHSVVSDTDDITGFEERTGHIDRDYYKGNILICESVWKPADALLISKAPEMLEMLQKVKSGLSRIKGSMMAHPDCIEGSEFDDYTNSAEEVENEIEKLIKVATVINEP